MMNYDHIWYAKERTNDEIKTKPIRDAVLPEQFDKSLYFIDV
jgi:hypothetical protein